MVKYASFDLIIQLVLRNGNGALMAKGDIEAFTNSSRRLSGFGDEGGDKYFIDIVDNALPMGASCSPALFEFFLRLFSLVSS